MKRLLLCLSATLCQLHALDIPPGGTDVRGTESLRAWASKAAGTAESLEQGSRITITHADAGKAYSAQFSALVAGGIAKNERVLAIIKARVVGSAASGEVMAKLQLRAAPYTAFAEALGVDIHREWTEQPVTFIASEDIPSGTATVVLLCGQKEQSLEVESIRVFKYPASTELSSFPRARLTKRSYPGREADAPWRKAALERIEQQRKANLSMVVKGDDGQPLANTEVKISLRRHAFGFGSAVVAKRFSSESEDDRRYREIIDRLFSIVVFENDLKDGNWAPDFDGKRKERRNTELNAAFAWLEERHISVRGHYLMQVATPFNLQGVKDSEVIRERTIASVKERLDFVRDRVIEWDVINHPIAWNGADMLNKRPGLEKLDREVFTLARTLTQLPFCVNEDQVFRPGPQCDDTLAYLQKLIADGYTVYGLGNQAHFHESYLPSPEHLLAVTDRFAKAVPHQCITEYDIVTTDDEELAADYTRDVLIAAFSHPAYTSFLLWGFWEGSHWKPEAASWSKDWSIRKRGEVLEEWIGRRWHTQATLKTDANGAVKWRGFPGWYELQAPGQKPVLVKAAPISTQP